jgi:hypothetical protein
MIIAENEMTVVAGAGNNYVLAEERKSMCSNPPKWKNPVGGSDRGLKLQGFLAARR